MLLTRLDLEGVRGMTCTFTLLECLGSAAVYLQLPLAPLRAANGH